MKKIITFSILLVASAAIFTACTKDHVCTCVGTESDNPSVSTTQVITYTKSTKSVAKANCASSTEVDNGVTYTKTCTLN